jgi:chlorobactene glucosyltransferase
VSVIVPARNEALNIERCLRSLLSQNYPDFEVIAVDDGSEDATPQILDRLAVEYPRLKPVHLSGQLPAGWAGKPHAMHEGERVARPESQWLLFTDADTYHKPQSLKRAVTEAVSEKVDLFSVLSDIEMRSFWEKLLMPIAVAGISIQYPLAQINAPDSKLAVANGQFLLVRRTMYDKVGGFGGKLRNSLLDDRDLALAVKANGGRLVLRNGRELVAVRMYRNFGEIWRGWRKNAFVGSRLSFVTVPVLILLCVIGGVLPFLQVPYAVIQWLRTRGKQGKSLFIASSLQVGAMLFTRGRLDRNLGLGRFYTVLNPLGMLVFAGILVDSMLRSLGGRGVNWKGRHYEKAAKSQNLI